MIYDCFAFFNELDLLEIRLNELNEVVDKFVIVEATRTFQKKNKPLYFNENKDRFKAFEDKIIHIIVDEYPTFFRKFRVPTVWDYDNHQKEQILRGLKNAKPDDVIIVSDLDEIPKAHLVKKYAYKKGIKVFEQRLYYYYLNCECSNFNTNGNTYIAQKTINNIGFWRGTVMLNYSDLKSIKLARRQRDLETSQHIIIKDGGWHFSYLGGIEKIQLKLASYAHPENNTKEINSSEFIKKEIKSGRSLFDPLTTFRTIPINETLPLYIQQNSNQYPHLIKNL